MFQIAYELSSSWNCKSAEIDLGKADEISLRYNVLLGNVRLRVGNTELGANCSWVPLIDFAACLKFIVDKLALSENAEAVYEFTESDAVIRFIRQRESIIIAPSYLNEKKSVSFVDFSSGVRMFVAQLATDLKERYPALELNATFRKLIELK